MKLILTCVILSALLTACGGGGGSIDSQSLSQPFVGTWRSGCYQDVDIKQSGGASIGTVTNLDLNGLLDSLYATKEMVITAVDNTNIAIKFTYKIYDLSDTNCSGTPLGTIVYTGQSLMSETINASGIESSYGANTATIVGDTSLSDGKVVSRLIFNVTKLMDATKRAYAGSDGAGHAGFTTTTGDFPAFTDKAIASINGSTMVIAFSQGAEAYPTALTVDNQHTFTKQ